MELYSLAKQVSGNPFNSDELELIRAMKSRQVKETGLLLLQ